ncbi:MAG: hypothetical protein OEY09_20885 [Gammaproteobacteria bacterium]|nr:hypothetical protein [Gammaproteobacteria bacterium]
MSNKRFSSWCKSVLPANYHQIKGQTNKVQRFLEEQLAEPVSQRIHVLNISAREIIVAVDDAQTANYLRLYQRELQQQVFETLNYKQTLKFKTMPGSLLQPGQRPQAKRPSKVSGDTADGITRNAQWIEDEPLKQALESLAASLKSKS